MLMIPRSGQRVAGERSGFCGKFVEDLVRFIEFPAVVIL
jgi:hypothetical protein